MPYNEEVDARIKQIVSKSGWKKTEALPFVRPFDITGRPMKGWVMVEREGFASDNELEKWLNQAKEFASTFPPK
jgi:hypothetical protein